MKDSHLARSVWSHDRATEFIIQTKKLYYKNTNKKAVSLDNNCTLHR